MLSRITLMPIVTLVIATMVFGCKDKGPTEPAPPDTTSNPPVVKKPNIYLYPESNQRISVQIAFPLGGKIVKSDPEYGLGWLVDVEPSGRINGWYDYLFYEAQTPDGYQYSSGWVVHRDTLSAFFAHTMTQVGFTARETKDFIDYWGPRLNSYPLYEVYPQQSSQLDGLIQLQVAPVPESQLRLFFVIRPADVDPIVLATPHLPKATRMGYHLAEWGVVLRSEVGLDKKRQGR